MFSLNMLDTEAQSNDGATMHVINPQTKLPAYLDADAKEPEKAVTITFLGLNSDAAKQAAIKEARVNARKAKGSRKGKDAEVNIPDDFFEATAEKDAERLSLLAIGWENMPDGNGGLIKFSKEKAYELFRDLKELRVQSDTFLGDDANFIPS